MLNRRMKCEVHRVTQEQQVRFENTKNTTKKQGAAEAKFIGAKAEVDTRRHLVYVPKQLKHWPSEDSTLVRELVDSIRPLLPQ